jgi:tetratricopeptide (TPR) repeat protein
LNLPFNLILLIQQEEAYMNSYPRFVFVSVFILVMLAPLNILAQPDHNSGDFQLSEKAKADVYFAQGKFKEALEFYKLVLEDETERGYIFRNMVKAWDALEALDQAEKFLNGYRQSNEKSSAVWYALGYLQYIKNDDSKAAELFKQATELDPQNGLAWNNWAASLVNGKHFQEALKKVRIAIRSNPKELMFFFNLKTIFEKMGEEQRFEEEYESSLKQGIKTWGYGKVLARSLRQKAFSNYDKGDLVGAIYSFEKILKVYQQIGDVNGEVPALFSLGILYEESGNVQKGHEFFKRVLSINPNHIQAREKIGP